MEEELRFLETALPEDWAAYPRSLFEAFAAHARMLRDTAPWCAALSREAYEQYVLCPRVNDEDLSEHRELFYSQLWDRVKDLDQEDAALEVNRWCHEQASYQAQDDRTASPLTVYRCGSGRCGEESAFLVAARAPWACPPDRYMLPGGPTATTITPGQRCCATESGGSWVPVSRSRCWTGAGSTLPPPGPCWSTAAPSAR